MPRGRSSPIPPADRVAIINTPGGGNSRNVRCPNVVPGVSPFLNPGGVLFLNPAAFSTPAPETFGDLPLALRTNSTTEANRVQPGEPYTAAAAGTFGRLTGTVGRSVGLGTPRQIQFALRFSL
jgi:hypothetical protein